MANSEVKEYWNDKQVASMYDKNLLKIEIESISKYLQPSYNVLDAGCGEAETTRIYAEKCKSIIGADFSDTRLEFARKNLEGVANVTLTTVDFIEGAEFKEQSFDAVISQRFLINIKNPEIQYKVIGDFYKMLKPGGHLLLLEGFEQGTKQLNSIRKELNLDEIPVKWHNLYFDDDLFESKITKIGFNIEAQKDFSLYFLLTRALNARLHHPNVPQWNDPLNNLAVELDAIVDIQGLSRLKLYVLSK
jgi:ubiquinone/menaquinone biosynthesis C-methylase UbiE